MSGKLIKTAGGVVGIIIVGTAAWVGLDNHWTTRSYHDVCLAAQEKVNEEIVNTLQMQQQAIKNQGDYNKLLLYQQMELEIMRAIADHPDDQRLKDRLEEVRRAREKFEREMTGD